jgi:hypothetical protein
MLKQISWQSKARSMPKSQHGQRDCSHTTINRKTNRTPHLEISPSQHRYIFLWLSKLSQEWQTRSEQMLELLVDRRLKVALRMRDESVIEHQVVASSLPANINRRWNPRSHWQVN